MDSSRTGIPEGSSQRRRANQNLSRASQGPTDAPRRQPQTMHYLYVLPTEHRKSLRSTLLGSDSTRLEWNEPNSIRASATTTIIFPSFSPLERQSIGKATFHPSLRRLLLAGTTFWRLRRQDIQNKKGLGVGKETVGVGSRSFPGGIAAIDPGEASSKRFTRLHSSARLICLALFEFLVLCQDFFLGVRSIN